VKILKERLMDSLLHKFYVFTLKRYDKYPAEYSKGYRHGMLEVIEEVNSYTEEEK
jgi:hypothetical protein